MLHSTKRSLYTNGTILIYVLVGIIAVLGGLFAVFKVFIPSKDAYAVVKVSAKADYSYQADPVINCYFFVDNDNRVNLTAGASTCGEVLTNKINFKSYKIEDAVKHYCERALVNDYLYYNNQFKIEVTIFTAATSDAEKQMANDITKTTNDFFANIGIKAATVVTISENVATPISLLTGYNFEAEGESQIEILKEKQQALNELIQRVRDTKAFVFNSRNTYFGKYRELTANFEANKDGKTKDELKELERTYNDGIDLHYSNAKYDSKEYKREALFNYEAALESNEEDYNEYITKFDLSSDKQDVIDEVKEYQDSKSVIYTLKGEQSDAE